MKKLLLSSAILLSALTLSGCISIHTSDKYDTDWQQRQEKNAHLISELELGSSRLSIVDALGTPDYSEAYQKDNKEYRILYYRTQHEHSDGKTSKDETTPLLFENDKLIAWGHQVLAKVK